MFSPQSKKPRSVPHPLPAWKRAVDLTCCAIALPVLFVAAAGLWVLLLCTSPGPLLFRQERIGLGGRRFVLYKFRTMHLGCDAGTHQAHVSELLRSNVPMRKLDGAGDKRLVPGAWLIRATGLDELPQVINVLLGDMSIVGPRPCIPYEYAEYSAWHRRRLDAAPGLTGLWQVSGKNRTTFDEMVRLDITYAETKSLWLDLSVIARTIPALLTQVREVRTAPPVEAAAAEPVRRPVAPRTAASLQA